MTPQQIGHAAMKRNAKERERKIVRLYALNGSKRATARKLGLHHTTVVKCIQRIGERV